MVYVIKATVRGLQSELIAQVAHPFHKTCQTAAYKADNMVNHTQHWPTFISVSTLKALNQTETVSHWVK